MSIDELKRYQWRETERGHWQRDIDEVEQFYTSLAKMYEGSGRMYFAITGHVSLTASVPEGRTSQDAGRQTDEALRNAWLRLRYDHPTLGAFVEYDEKRKLCVKIYHAFVEEKERETWLDKTFRTIHTGVTGEEWCNSDPPAPTLPTLFVIAPRAHIGQESEIVRRDIVLRSPHDITDGIGTLHLFNNLLKHASEFYSSPSEYQLPVFGSEITNLSPPFRVATDLPLDCTPAQKSLFDGELAYNTSVLQDCELMSIPFKQGAMLPGKHQRVALKLTNVQTRKLLEASRQLSASVTHLFHAAIAMSIRDMQKPSANAKTMRYISYCLINERSRCAPPFNTARHAAAVYHSVSGKNLVVDLDVPGMTDSGKVDMNAREREFMNIVKVITAFYSDTQADADRLPLIPLLLAHKTPHYPVEALPVPSPNPSPSVSLSSMGVIDNVIAPKHGAFILHNPWVTGEELGTGLGVFLGTWNGKLGLSAAYNEAWHEKSEVKAYLQRCVNVVVKGMGLDGFWGT